MFECKQSTAAFGVVSGTCLSLLLAAKPTTVHVAKVTMFSAVGLWLSLSLVAKPCYHGDLSQWSLWIVSTLGWLPLKATKNMPSGSPNLFQPFASFWGLAAFSWSKIETTLVVLPLPLLLGPLHSNCSTICAGDQLHSYTSEKAVVFSNGY